VRLVETAHEIKKLYNNTDASLSSAARIKELEGNPQYQALINERQQLFGKYSAGESRLPKQSERQREDNDDFSSTMSIREEMDKTNRVPARAKLRDETPTLKTLTARLKHMPGKHDQSAHGKPGRVGSAFRGAYSAARAGGASHVEARNQAKSAAEQVRETIRAEKRAERIANPKPKRIAPPRAETTTTPTTPEYPNKTQERLSATRDELYNKLSDIRRQISDTNPSEVEYKKLIQQSESIKDEISKIRDELFENGQKWQERYAAAERAANPEPTPTTPTPPRATTPTTSTTPPRADTTTKWQSFLDKSKAEYAAAQDAYQAAISDKNATMESLTAAQRARDAAGDKWTRDQATANQMAAVESAAPPPRATSPTTPTTPTTPTRAVGEYPRPKVGETVAQHLDRLYQHRAAIISKDDAIPREEQLALLSAGRKRKTNITPAEQAELDKAAREIARIERKIQRLEVSRTDQAGNPTKAEREVARQEVKANMPTELLQRTTNNLQRTLDSGIDPKTKRKLTKAQRDLYTFMVNGNRAELARRDTTTKADDSVGGTPRKYGARAGEVIAGNLGRDTGGKFTRVGEDATSVIRAAINRGFASAGGGGKRGAKRAAVSDAQKKRQQADTGAGVMDKLGFDASDWDYLASDKPQDASDPQFTRLIEQGLMDNVDGMAYPSALGRKVAAAAGAGNEDKAKELLARDTAKRSARQAKMDAQISAYDEVINDETASPRARAIAARRRTMLIGQSGTSTKATDSVNLYMQGNNEPYAINTPNDIAGAYHKRIMEQDGPEGRDDFKAELIAIAKRKGPDYVRKLPQKWKDEMESNTTKSRWFDENSEGEDVTKADDGYTPPAGVRAQAKRGLALRSEFGRGGTSVGIARARDLSNGKRMSRDTIMRMVSFFARHAVDKRPDWGNPSKPSNGYIAHLLWGGDAGKSWANKIANQIKAGE
jgi:hypothetical protein